MRAVLAQGTRAAAIQEGVGVGIGDGTHHRPATVPEHDLRHGLSGQTTQALPIRTT